MQYREVGVWVLWIGIQAGVSRIVPSHAKSVSVLLPQSFLEVVLWVATYERRAA